jgi:hypothetical protein
MYLNAGANVVFAFVSAVGFCEHWKGVDDTGVHNAINFVGAAWLVVVNAFALYATHSCRPGLVRAALILYIGNFVLDSAWLTYVEIVLPGKVAVRPAALNSFNVSMGLSVAFDVYNSWLTWVVLGEVLDVHEKQVPTAKVVESAV